MERQISPNNNISVPNHVIPAEGILELVQNVSQSGAYQKKIAIYFLLTAFFTAIPVYASHFYYQNPVFSCDNTEGKVVEDDACSMIQFCTILNKSTITSELSLSCDSRKESRILIQTAQGYGVWLGIITVFFFSDRFGKKSCFIFGVVLLNLTWICQFVGVYLDSVFLLFIADIVMGSTNRLIFINFLVLSTRFLKKEEYEMITLAWLIANRGLAQMTVAGIDLLFESWRTIAVIYAVGTIWASIAAYFVLKEDPVFLVDSGQTERAKIVIRQVGEQNGQHNFIIEQNINKVDYYASLVKNKAGGKLEGASNFDLREILRCDIMLNTFLIGLAGFFYMLSSKSIEFSIQELEQGYDFNVIVISLSNICGYLTAACLIKREKQRKRGLIYSIVIYCIIAMLFFFPFCTESGVVESFVIFFLRFFLSWNCIFYTMLQADTFPEKYQASIICIAESLISIGVIIGPPLVQLSIDHHANPILMVAILRFIIGFAPMFLLKEGKIQLQTHQSNLNLPQNHKSSNDSE